MSETDLKEALRAFERGDLSRAKAIAEQSAGGSSASPQIEHLLGLIHCRLGDPSSGADHLRRAADAEPRNPHHLIMLSRALVDSGRAADALQLRKPSRSDGTAAAALWLARAEAASAVGEAEAAVEAWQAFAEARPADWRAWNNAGTALAGLERWGQAAAALGKAVQLNPTDVSLRRSLAAALGNGGWVRESTVELADVLALDPNQLDVRVELANALERFGELEQAMRVCDEAPAASNTDLRLAMGRARLLVLLERYEEAEQAFREAVRSHPDDPDPRRELGLLLERVGRIDALRELLRETGGSEFPSEDFAYLHAALALRDGDAAEAKRLLLESPADADPVRGHRLKAKIEDALGNAGEAFKAAAAMNSSVSGFAGWLDVAAAYRGKLRELDRKVTPDWVSRLTTLESRDERRSPVFLVGFPRSGTTLLDTFLMGHPGIRVVEEVHLLGEAEKVIVDIGELPNVDESKLQEARDAYFALLDQHVDRQFGGIVVDKLPLNLLAAPLMRVLFPDAKIIFAQRHPCDSVLSGFMQSFILNDSMASFLDLTAGADLYDAATSLWIKYRQLLPLNVHTITYERLVEDAEAELRPLVAFLGLEWNDALLDHKKTAEARGTIITASYDQVTKPLHAEARGRWRRYEKQLKPVLPVLLPWAERLGYTD